MTPQEMRANLTAQRDSMLDKASSCRNLGYLEDAAEYQHFADSAERDIDRLPPEPAEEPEDADTFPCDVCGERRYGDELAWADDYNLGEYLKVCGSCYQRITTPHPPTPAPAAAPKIHSHTVELAFTMADDTPAPEDDIPAGVLQNVASILSVPLSVLPWGEARVQLLLLAASGADCYAYSAFRLSGSPAPRRYYLWLNGTRYSLPDWIAAHARQEGQQEAPGDETAEELSSRPEPAPEAPWYCSSCGAGMWAAFRINGDILCTVCFMRRAGGADSEPSSF